MKRQGFTLIELLIVVLIIAILAAIAVPNFLEFQTRAKVSRAKADMRTVRTALEAYAVDYSDYPDHATDTWHPSLLEIPTLTTPIAYITTFPAEAFPRKVDPLYNNTNMFGDGDYYRYYNTKRWEITYPELPGEGLKWYLVSHGPDLDNDLHDDDGDIAQDALDGLSYMHYDPTNGTLSSGDIINNNKRSSAP
ncbi:type IV pilin protein [Candidatus Sumerlaeota bacterium]